jgi:outer membrane protein TolC
MKKHSAILLIAAWFCAPAHAEPLDKLSLEQSLRIALQNHRSIHVSQAALDMAEAQYQQAMAAFGPKLSLEGGFQRADQNRTYNFQGTIQPPPVDASMLMGAPPGTIVMPVAPIAIDLDTKLFDRDLTRAGLNLNYPLYTGGKQQAMTGMAKKGVDIAREEKRKAELDIVRDVHKYYHGAQLAKKMAQLANDTLERFQALEDLTDRLYQNSSLKVKKTDYLRSKTTTAMTRSMVRETAYATALTHEALANAMGLPVNSQVGLAPEASLPRFDAAFDPLLAEAMQFNPDKQRLELAVQAAEHKIDDARSSLYPMVGLEATAYRVWNDYAGGLVNKDNRAGWTIGIGVKWDLFDSGLTKASVDAARAGKIKLESQRILLDNGLALQIKNQFLRIQSARQQVEDSAKARDYAEENRKLNVRAYQEEMVETKDVIEAQLIETFASANLYRVEHDLRTALADLDYLVGKELRQGKP